MRPTPIPDAEIWEGAVRRVISPPDGDLTNPDIAPVEALIDRSPSTGAICLSVRLELEDGDLEKLTAGGKVWVTFWGQITPFAVSVVGQRAPVETTVHVVQTPAGFTESFSAHTIEVLERLGLIEHERDGQVLEDGQGNGVGSIHRFYRQAGAS